MFHPKYPKPLPNAFGYPLNRLVLNWEELKDESLENLVEFVQLKGDPEAEEWANSAFVILTYRFRKDVLQKCTVMCRKSGYTETVAEEIANRVFERFFRYSTFKSAKCKVADIEKCFRLYLYKIARNEFLDFAKPDESPYTGEEKVINSVIQMDFEYEPEKLKQLKEAERMLDDLFSKLTPKHKIIFLTYQHYEKEGKYLPKRLREELKDVLQLSQSSIRVYKKEAFELFNARFHGK